MARGELPDIPEADRAEGSPHPREVYTLLGHADAEQRFLQAQNSGRLHHAWLITGPTGIGKATLAYRIARHMLGGQSLLEGRLDIPQSDPVSTRIEAQGHGNVFVLRRPYDPKTKKLKSAIPVDNVRKLSGFFQETASEENTWRICLIDSADELNRNSENAILKLLEEPPAQTLFLLLSSAPGQLLPTIRSRCMNLALRPVEQDQIKDWLTGQTNEREDILQAAAALSRGAPGRALSLARNADTVLKPLSRFLASLDRPSSDVDIVIAKSMASPSAAQSRALFWDALQDILQAQSVYAATGEWRGAFKPLPTNKPANVWERLWEVTGESRHIEQAIYLEKTTNMLSTLTQIRTA